LNALHIASMLSTFATHLILLDLFTVIISVNGTDNKVHCATFSIPLLLPPSQVRHVDR
jgi:hypothetical protein